MKKIKRIAACLTICASLAFSSIAHADVVLEYTVKGMNVPAGTTQNIAIKNDQIMVKAVGGDKNLDLLYRHAAENVVIIDHRKGTLMTVDEQQVDRINQQTQNVQIMLQALGGQIANLSPEQRQQLQALLGDSVSLDTIAKAAAPPAPTRLVPTGVKREVAGIRCQMMRVMQGVTPVAEVCLADAATMKISDNDAATIRAFFSFYERLATKGQGLACQLGLTLPNIAAREVTGIPIEFRELSRKDSGTMTLRRINTSAVSPELMRIPSGYKAVPLTLLP
jgi:hypothetical protein